jgi:hypothetical protein
MASKFCWLIAHVGAWWMLADMILDGLTVHTYWAMCQEGELECWMWMVGVAFLLLPTIVSTLVHFTCGCPGDPSGYAKIIDGPLYFVSAPLIAIYLTGANLCGCRRSHNEEYDKQNVAFRKMPEMLCEALPQVSCTSIPHNTHPGDPHLHLPGHQRDAVGAGGPHHLHLDPLPQHRPAKSANHSWGNLSTLGEFGIKNIDKMLGNPINLPKNFLNQLFLHHQTVSNSE